MQLALGDADGAKAMLNRAIQSDPGDTALREDLARVLESEGDLDGARSQREIAGQLNGSELAVEGGDAPQPALAPRRHSVTLDQYAITFASKVNAPRERRIVALGVRQPWTWRAIPDRLFKLRTVDVALIDDALGFGMFHEAQAIVEHLDALGPEQLVDRGSCAEVSRAVLVWSLNEELAVPKLIQMRLNRSFGKSSKSC